MYIYTYIDIYILIIFVCVYTYVYIRMYNISTNIKSFSHCNPTCISSIYIYPQCHPPVLQWSYPKASDHQAECHAPSRRAPSTWAKIRVLADGSLAFTQRSLYTGAFTHKGVYRQKLLRKEVSTQRAFTHGSFHTQKFLHGKVFAQRSFYTQKLFHTEVFYTSMNMFKKA